jgi:flagellum-specific peptidoglycan hydrolase FlgJ
MVKLIKAHWFSIGIVLIAAYAVTKKYSTVFQTANHGKSQKQTEKFTQKPPEVVEMGLANSPSATLQIEDVVALAFLKRFSQVAVGEYKKFGLPASIVLANAYVNSHAGQHTLAKEANNMFKLPCTSEWAGPTISYEGHCYRKYERPWDSFRDFSNYLHHKEWFANARQHLGGDWQKWLDLLVARKIASVESQKSEIQRVIEHYRLFELDDK